MHMRFYLKILNLFWFFNVIQSLCRCSFNEGGVRKKLYSETRMNKRVFATTFGCQTPFFKVQVLHVVLNQNFEYLKKLKGYFWTFQSLFALTIFRNYLFILEKLENDIKQGIATQAMNILVVLWKSISRRETRKVTAVVLWFNLSGAKNVLRFRHSSYQLTWFLVLQHIKEGKVIWAGDVLSMFNVRKWYIISRPYFLIH